MKIKLTKDCEVECWSGCTETYVQFSKGDVFTVIKDPITPGYYTVENDEVYGDMYIREDCA
tara:strand:+ start:1036 stop:1218 length:183 start_codon:yes stop_codon:yes gene_type:complete